MNLKTLYKYTVDADAPSYKVPFNEVSRVVCSDNVRSGLMAEFDFCFLK